MRVADVLESEHRVIMSVLDSLERTVGATDPKLALPTIRSILEFLDFYLVQIHQSKEDEILLPFLRDSHPEQLLYASSQWLLHDHTELIILLEESWRLLERLESGAIDRWRVLRSKLQDLVEKSRDHIRHEELVLFPEMTEILSHSENSILVVDFYRLESEICSATRYADLITFARSLPRRTADPVPRASEALESFR